MNLCGKVHWRLPRLWWEALSKLREIAPRFWVCAPAPLYKKNRIWLIDWYWYYVGSIIQCEFEKPCSKSCVTNWGDFEHTCSKSPAIRGDFEHLFKDTPKLLKPAGVTLNSIFLIILHGCNLAFATERISRKFLNKMIHKSIGLVLLTYSYRQKFTTLGK